MNLHELSKILSCYFNNKESHRDINCVLNYLDNNDYKYVMLERDEKDFKRESIIIEKNNIKYHLTFLVPEINLFTIDIYKNKLEEKENFNLQIPIIPSRWLEEQISISFSEGYYAPDIDTEEIIKYIEDLNYYKECIEIEYLNSDKRIPDLSELIIQDPSFFKEIAMLLKNPEKFTIENILKKNKKQPKNGL